MRVRHSNGTVANVSDEKGDRLIASAPTVWERVEAKRKTTKSDASSDS